MKKIKLYQGKHGVKYALVDDADYEEVSKYKWHAWTRGYAFYAIRAVKVGSTWTTVRLHRHIMKPKKGQVVDHRNGDGLDNRRKNLRVCSQYENNLNRHRLRKDNTSGYHGVDFDKARKKWRAQCQREGKKYLIGHFDSAEEAASAYKNFKP